MKFKTPQIAEQWRRVPPPSALRNLIEKADIYRAALDKEELTITCYIDERPGKPSYHPLARAVDVRVHGMTDDVRRKVLAFMTLVAQELNTGALSGTGKKLDVVAHEELLGTPRAHIHIEFDGGDPFRPGDTPPAFAEVVGNNDHEQDGA